MYTIKSNGLPREIWDCLQSPDGRKRVVADEVGEIL